MMEMSDGTYYFFEFSVPRVASDPVVLRSTVADGIPTDTVWSPRRRTWVRTDKLLKYRHNMGENDLFSVTAQQAEEAVRRKQGAWDDTHTSQRPEANS